MGRTTVGLCMREENPFENPFGGLRENYTKNLFFNNAVTFLIISNETIIILNENKKMKLKYLKTELQ